VGGEERGGEGLWHKRERKGTIAAERKGTIAKEQ